MPRGRPTDVGHRPHERRRRLLLGMRLQRIQVQVQAKPENPFEERQFSTLATKLGCFEDPCLGAWCMAIPLPYGAAHTTWYDYGVECTPEPTAADP